MGFCYKLLSILAKHTHLKRLFLLSMKWVKRILLFWKRENSLTKEIDKLQSDDPQVRQSAVKTLGTLGVRVFVALIHELEDVDNNVRQESIEAIKQFIHHLPVETLPQILQDNDSGVRLETAEMLGTLAQIQASDMLLAALDDESPAVRAEVIHVLKQTKNPDILKRLLPLLNDPDEEIRAEIAIVLRRQDPSKIVTPCLLRLRKEENVLVRGEIAKTLSQVKDKRMLRTFIHALESDSHWYVRNIAINVLGNYKHPTIRTTLIKALLDSDNSVRTTAADMLDKRGWFPETDLEKAYYFLAKEEFTRLLELGASVIAPLTTIRKDNEVFRDLASTMLQQIYASLEIVIFGDGLEKIDLPRTTLYNPDVSKVTFPMTALKKIAIYPDSYQFHQLECFLTYAVNHIGQQTLKIQVEATIYGTSEKLHANLRNALQNICKHVHEG